jgi:hypothetical protein
MVGNLESNIVRHLYFLLSVEKNILAKKSILKTSSIVASPASDIYLET